MQARVVALGGRVAGGRDDADLDVFEEEVWGLLAEGETKCGRRNGPINRGTTGLVGSRLWPSS